MTLRFIAGRAGKGKSYYIYSEIKQHLQTASSKEKLILLVPEQYTLQAERDFMDKTGMEGIMQLEILSFSRLAQRVFDEAGGLTRIIINEQGKSMVLRRVMEELEGQLLVYKNSCRQNGFVNELMDFIAGLKQRAVDLRDIDEMRLNLEGDSLLRRKLHDLALIYDQFNTFLHQHYIDSEDYINLFIEKMSFSRYLPAARIWVDNFATFSPQSLRILEKLISVCPETTVSITMDNGKSSRDEELFALSRRSYHKLVQTARTRGIATRVINLDGVGADRLRGKELLHLERELFAYPSRRYPGAINRISIFAAANPDSEVEDLATRLITLVRDEGYRWKDIAVICNDLDNYGGLLKRIFQEHDIPFFMDQKKGVMDNPIVEFILASLHSVERGYLFEDVFRGLKTGLGALDDEACEKLENYVLSYGIRGGRWKEPFSRGEAEKLEDLNLWREAVIAPLEEMKTALAEEKTFAGITRALYDYLDNLGVQQKLGRWAEELWGQELYEVVHEYTQIWNMVIETFDQMVEILGEQRGSLKDYIKVLEAGFSSHELGMIPTTVDQVLVGNIQRSKSHNIKALFVMGVNDGIIPSAKHNEGVLSSDESDYLADQGVDISENLEMQVAEENFLIYGAFSKCQQKLFLSYAGSDSEGRALRPSLLLERIRYLFPGLQSESGLVNDRRRQLQMVSRPRSSFKHLIENLRFYLDKKTMEDFWWDVYDWYRRQDQWQERCGMLAEAFFHRNQVEPISPGLARRLYNFPLRGSITRLEQFIACPFAHFIRYGLFPRERKEFSVKAPDIGELFHNSLLGFALEVEKRPGKWHAIEREECESMMDTVMDGILAAQEAGVFFSSNRYRYLSRRLKRIGRRAAWVVSEHINRGSFTPLGYEIRFGNGQALPALAIELENGERMYLEGRIDRVDILDGDAASYVRIIDYKTGDKRLNLADCYYGLSLQLLIYLRAVLASEQKLERPLLKPGGIFYFKIDDPLIKTEHEVLEVVEQQLAKELKLRGLALEDVHIVREMDRDITASSDIIPVGLKQDDSFNSNSAVLSEEDFDYLLRHVDNLLVKAGAELAGGKVKIEPYKLEKHTACDFCIYSSICQFDRQLPENRYRHLPPLKDVEAIRKIRAENRGGSANELD
ncbi:helicase-exonuclease AddAB subunit AddB [Syntrophomonas curvata]